MCSSLQVSSLFGLSVERSVYQIPAKAEQLFENSVPLATPVDSAVSGVH